MASPCLADTLCIALDDPGGTLAATPILSGDVDQGVECRADGFWAPAVAPTVSTLPGAGDYDGQRRAYQPSISGLDNDIQWDMRWDASYGAWFYMGGAPAVDHIPDAESITAGSGSWVGLATPGPNLLMPYNGAYAVHFGAVINGAEAGTNTLVGIQIDGVDPSNARSLYEGGQSQYHTAAGFITVALSGSRVIRMRYQRNGTASDATFLNRWISIVPIHLNP